MSAAMPKRKKKPAAVRPDEPGMKIEIPDWPDDEAPPAMRVYNFSIKGMMLLAAACPDRAIQLAAMRVLRDEFTPQKATVSATTEVEVIAKLRQALAAEVPLDEIELEREVSGTVALPPAKEQKETP